MGSSNDGGGRVRVAHRTECSPVMNAFECSECLRIYPTGSAYISAGYIVCVSKSTHLPRNLIETMQSLSRSSLRRNPTEAISDQADLYVTTIESAFNINI